MSGEVNYKELLDDLKEDVRTLGEKTSLQIRTLHSKVDELRDGNAIRTDALQKEIHQIDKAVAVLTTKLLVWGAIGTMVVGLVSSVATAVIVSAITR